MFTITGEITIRIRTGRYGPFPTAILSTSVGTFCVKDKLIEQFEEGTYEGVFVVKKIVPQSYMAGSRIVMEVRAELAEIILNDQSPNAPDYAHDLEQDPIQEEAIHDDTPPVDHNSNEFQQDDFTDHSDQSGYLFDLFGSLWPLGNSVKLDPTVSRGRLREQTNYLSQMGYKFSVRTQLWSLNQSNFDRG
jgi:hypothetical protein